jgi:OmpA-OmpF porin, OOP family
VFGAAIPRRVVVAVPALIACATGPKPRSGDGDGDGVPDDLDLCPDRAEDSDGVDDRDGCPEFPARYDGNAPASEPLLDVVVDTDADGIRDERDACPNDPEDKDQFEDDDGCPELDNDRDRILDRDDKCPNEPEIYNNVADDDGCPDGPRALLRCEIRFVNVVFLQGRAVIEPGQAPVVDSLAVRIKEKCRGVEVQGHASDAERRPEALATARTEAVRAALIARGVSPEQVKVRSLGTAQPLCREATETCRARNRRAELILLDLRICK